MSASTTNVSDLPLPLRTRIVSAVRALPRPPPLQPSLHHLQKLYRPLPAELLPIAQSSSTLSSAVADTLGVRALILTSHVAKSDLPKWIAALAPFVKAVSFFDAETLNCCHPSHVQPVNWLIHVIPAFEAMAAPEVALHTLDISEIPVMCATDEKKLLEALVGALASKKDSLRELAVPLNEICVSALQQVPLPYLQVIQLESPIEYRIGIETGKTAGCRLIDVFKALDGHADKHRSESDLELRVKYVIGPPVPDGDECGCGKAFYKRIRTLDVQNWSWNGGDEEDKIASFVALFPHIHCFRWDGTVTSKFVGAILMACPELAELHFFQGNENTTELLRVVELAHGKLQTLRMNGFLSEELAASLGRSNPDLHTFSAQIGPDNIAALTPLLATHCRKLRRLSLSIFNPDEDQQRCLRSRGWRKFSEAMQSASTELRDIIVECGSEHGPSEPDVKDLVDAVASVLESLKDRARIVRFHVLAGVVEYRVMIDALCRLLDVATRNCRNVEVLSLRFHVGDADLMWNNDEEKKVKCRQVLCARRRFTVAAAAHLHHLDLDGFDEEAEEILREMEEV